MNLFKKKLTLIVTAGLLLVFCVSATVFSHCEIPCGIYDDSMRINMIAEHIKTIEKSMNQIHKLSEDKDKNYNQLTRWIVNKENHSDKLSDIVTQYFMKQRIKPAGKSDGDVYKKYVKELTLLHKLMVYSMKCKQTTDLDNVEKLKETLSEFKKSYIGTEESSEYEHDHQH
jgi:nickel superoxide dismutase